MSERPILSNPSVGGGEVKSSLPYSYAADVNDPDRASGLGDYIKEGILRLWRKVQGSYRYLGAKRTTFSPRSGTGTQVIQIENIYEPAELSPLVWMEGDGQLLESPNAGGVIALWADRSGNENHATQPVNTKMPALGTVQGLYQTINFTGDDLLSVSLPSPVLQPLTIALVVKTPAIGGNIKYILNGSNVFTIQLETSGAVSIIAGGSGGALTTPSPVNAGWHVIIAHFCGPNSFIRVDGVTVATGSSTIPGTLGVASFMLGNNPAANRPMGGAIAALMIFNRTLSPMEILLVENYLARKGPGGAILPSTAILKNGFSLSPAWTPAVWEGKIAAWFDASRADSFVMEFPWTPSSLGGVVRTWHKADAITGVANGAPVASWPDSSGNNKHATNAAPSEQPLYIENAIGGKPAVRFDGIDDDLTVLAPGNTKPTTMFMVGRYLDISVSADRRPVNMGTGLAFRLNGVANTADFSILGNLGLNYGTDKGDVLPHIHYGMWSNLVNVSEGSMDGAAPTVGNAGTSGAATNLIFGGSGTGTVGANIDLAEVITISGALSQSDREKVEGYLAWKYGIARSLPVGHPYRLSGPTISQWNDLSGNSRHAIQATVANQPTYDLSLGYPAVKFDGLNDSLTVGNATAGSISAQPYTVAAVWFPAASASQRLFEAIGPNAVYEMINATPDLQFSAGSPRTAVFTEGELTFTVITFNGASSHLDIKGAWSVPSSLSTNALSGFTLGSNKARSTEFLNGHILEFIVLPFAITPDDRRSLDGYFFWKYGIGSPTTPWDNAGPMQPYFDDPWTPERLTKRTLRAWFRADGIKGFAHNAPLTEWVDESDGDWPLDRTAEASASYEPTYKNPGTLNGLPSVDFSGGTVSLVSALPSDGTTETIIAVIDADTISGKRAILGAIAANGRSFILDGGKLRVITNLANFNAGSTAAVSANTPTIVGVEISNTATVYNINGVTESVAHAQAINFTISKIGSDFAGDYFDGEIFEVIATSKISVEGRQFIEGYLAWKYGISGNLPSTHPYRFQRPNLSGLGVGDFGWTMEVRDSLGGIDGTGYLGRNPETLAPDGKTDFSTGDGANILVSMPARMMYLWPRRVISGYYYHDYGVPSTSIQSRLRKLNDSGSYQTVAESVALPGAINGAAISFTWDDMGLPSLQWNGQYALEWRATDENGFVSDWHGPSYFKTDATPLRPINLSPANVAVTGYPLVTFSAEDPDDDPGPPTGPVWPFIYSSKVTGLIAPAAMAQEVATGNLMIVDGGSRISIYTADLGTFIQNFGSSGVGNGQFFGLTSISASGGGVLGLSTAYMFTSETTNLRIQKMTRNTLGGIYAYNNKIATDAAWDVASDETTVYAAVDYGISLIPLAALTPITKWSMPTRIPMKIAINKKKRWLYVIAAFPVYTTVYDIDTREELFTFGQRGSGPGEFSGANPGGGNFEIDETTGLVYWLDESSDVLQVYDALGNQLAIYNIPQGLGNGQFTSGARSVLPSLDGGYIYISDLSGTVQRLSVMTDEQLAAQSVLNAEVLVSYPVSNFGKYADSTEGASITVGSGFTTSLAWDGSVGNEDVGSLKMTISAAPASTTTTVTIYPFSQKWPVVPGEEYAFNVAIRSSSPLLKFEHRVRWYDKNNSFVGTVYNNPMGDNLEYTAYGIKDFLTLSTFGVAPAVAAFAECSIVMTRTTTAAFSGPQYVWIDDANFGGDARFLKEATHLGSGNFSWQPTATEMDSNRTYKIRARGKDAVQVGPWSDVAIIQKVTGPTVVIDSPSPDQVFQSVSPLILWRVTSGSQWAFKVNIYDVSTLGVAYDSGWVQSESARSFLVSPGYLEDGGSYFLRMEIDDGTIKVLV